MDSYSCDTISFSGHADVSLSGLTAAQLLCLGLTAPHYAGYKGLTIFQLKPSRFSS